MGVFLLNGSRGGIPSLRPMGAGRLTKCATDSGVGSYDTIGIFFVLLTDRVVAGIQPK